MITTPQDFFKQLSKIGSGSDRAIYAAAVTKLNAERLKERTLASGVYEVLQQI